LVILSPKILVWNPGNGSKNPPGGGGEYKPTPEVEVAMEVTKPYKFIGFVAMEVTKPYKFIGFGGGCPSL
jgi:hypothetical protein